MEKSIPETLREQRAPMALLVSDNQTASKRALSRLLQIVVALAARTHKFVRACPTVLKRKRSCLGLSPRMRHALMFRSFASLINNVFIERRKRRLAMEANRRCMRIFRALQARCFDRWHIRAARKPRAKRFAQAAWRHKAFLVHKMEKKWADHAREKECEALAMRFIRRYQLRCVLKCLHALHTHAVGVIKLRKYVQRWINKKLVAAIFAWRSLVELNKKVRDFIRRQLQGMRDHCFEYWRDKTVEEKDHRQRILSSALYKMRNRIIVASFAAFIKFRDLALNARFVQRVFHGFSGRQKAKHIRTHVLMVEADRNRAEEMEVDHTAEVVKEFQEKFWAEISPEMKVIVGQAAARLKHHYKEEALLREAAGASLQTCVLARKK